MSQISAAVFPWRLCVAPMMDWTDRHCRVFHRLLAPHARLYTEMVHASAVLHGDRTRLLALVSTEHPVALQLGGSEPHDLAMAARVGERAGFDEINLNVGCPSDRVQKGRFGACLMREPQQVGECVRAMQDAVGVPITVKCRIGVDEQDSEAALQQFAENMIEAGLGVLIVHARKAWLRGLSPKENRAVPPLNYDRVYRLKQVLPGLQVVINGGIRDVLGVHDHLAQVDGVMLGRAAYHDPYVLACIDADLWATDSLGRDEVLLSIRPYVEAELARGTPLPHMARHFLGLYHGQPGARCFRRVLSERMRNPQAGWEALEQAMRALSLPTAGSARVLPLGD